MKLPSMILYSSKFYFPYWSNSNCIKYNGYNKRIIKFNRNWSPYLNYSSYTAPLIRHPKQKECKRKFLQHLWKKAIFHKTKRGERGTPPRGGENRPVHFDLGSRAAIKHGFLYPRQRYLKNIIESMDVARHGRRASKSFVDIFDGRGLIRFHTEGKWITLDSLPIDRISRMRITLLGCASDATSAFVPTIKI